MISNIEELSKKELKEIQTFLTKRNIDVQINYQPQKVRRMEDGGLVIDPPQFTTKFVKVISKKTNGEAKIEAV